MMPTYEYRCEACGHRFEQLQSITAAPLKECPVCKKRALQRLLGAGGGLIFKGSGFYQTDYRSESYKKAAEAEKASSGSTGESQATGGKSGQKTASRPGSKKIAKPKLGACSSE
jgi:putative FmdB family regulatory protein